jgi:hypothetical protein
VTAVRWCSVVRPRMRSHILLICASLKFVSLTALSAPSQLHAGQLAAGSCRSSCWHTPVAVKRHWTYATTLPRRICIAALYARCLWRVTTSDPHELHTRRPRNAEHVCEECGRKRRGPMGRSGAPAGARLGAGLGQPWSDAVQHHVPRVSLWLSGEAAEQYEYLRLWLLYNGLQRESRHAQHRQHKQQQQCRYSQPPWFLSQRGGITNTTTT